jgi:signal transduction histidine kinase/DNA-binding ferritin-like protein
MQDANSPTEPQNMNERQSILAVEAIDVIGTSLRVLLADVFALYMKTKNFHWHMRGAHFRDYHLLLDEQGEQLFAMSDVIAERSRKLGATTIHSVGEIVRLKRLADNDATVLPPRRCLSFSARTISNSPVFFERHMHSATRAAAYPPRVSLKTGSTRQRSGRGFSPQAPNSSGVSGRQSRGRIMDKLDIGRREERALDSDLTQGSASNDYNSTNDTVQSKQEMAVRAIVAALRGIESLAGLTPHEYLWLASQGAERVVGDKSVVFREGEPAHHMNILLNGEIYVHRRNAGSVLSTIGRTGQITGKLPYSRMKEWGGEGCSSGSLWLLDIHEDAFPEMLRAIPSMAQRCVSILLDRVRDFMAADLGAEKLSSLGKLAANLSHELKNPASAAQRAAISLSTKANREGELLRLGRLFSSEEEVVRYVQWTRRMSQESGKLPIVFEPPHHDGTALSDLDREERLLEWLEVHQVTDAWAVAPALTTANVQISDLDALASMIGGDTLSPALTSFSKSLNDQQLLELLSASSQRIFDIISAIQDYSYMDQAPIQEVDLSESLGNALALLKSDLKDVNVVLDFDPSLSSITGYGAELSQLWTALIENALDAMNGRGVLTISAKPKGEMAFVEVCDNGTGIDPEIISSIFEPFFTTKPLGQGLGLGLDTVRRIVNKHFGSVTVESSVAGTCFQVRLPVRRPQIY